MTVELIPASRFTIDQLTAAYNQARIDYVVPMPMTARRLQEYIDVYDVNLDASVVALNGETMLGLCLLGLRNRRAWVTRLGVLPDSRRHGCGRAMVEYCVAQAVERCVAIITLEVIVGNDPAYRLFEKVGFRPVRRLLILRRPPGTPPANHQPPESALEWLGTSQTLQYAASRPWRPAWINENESLANAGGVQGLHIVENGSGRRGWLGFQSTPFLLRRVVVGPEGASGVAPAYALLHHLHARFPTLDTVAENMPADAPHLDAFYAHGYVNSFARIEMELLPG